MVSAARITSAVLGRIAGGRLRRLPFAVAFWDGSSLPAGEQPSIGTVLVRRAAIGHLLHEPNQLGLVRAFVLGDLDFDGEIEDLLAQRARFGGLEVGRRDVALGLAAALLLGGRDVLRRPRIPASELRPAGAKHSRDRDRTVVQHHYDVSNAFYRRLLGPSLVYSCAYFAAADETLEAAQERKLELICAKLRLQPDERLLDVGCGWGALLIHAAERHGVRGVGITLSEQQAALARERVREAGLADRIEIRVADYRQVADGPYDKIASVGMVEHVGIAQLPAYAATLARLLRPGGLLLNHGIAQLFSESAGEKSLIQRYVFPDGELPRLPVILSALQEAGLEPRDRRVAARALRPDVAPLGRQPRRRARGHRRRGRGGARARLAPLHHRLGARIRGQRHQRLPGARDATWLAPRAAAGARGAGQRIAAHVFVTARRGPRGEGIAPIPFRSRGSVCRQRSRLDRLELASRDRASREQALGLLDL
ncbi:MAG TPA: cyclopropane-fatty-acyl-phospholipid synthase family protein [Conexibacter sp.]|jgi:cyclopropane-fatty-acyl-phospholipid synthase